MTKKQSKGKDFVTLRHRERSNGRKALYLDICRDGIRKAEYLKLYLVPEQTRADKAANKETLRQAETIRAQRVIEMRSRQLGIEYFDSSKVLFYDFMDSLIEHRKGTTKKGWRNCKARLLQYDPNLSLTFRDITPQWVQGFYDYLDTKARQWEIDPKRGNTAPNPISAGTKAVTFQRFCCVLNEAVRRGIINRKPHANIKRFREPEANREFLTIDELRTLSQFPHPTERMGRAFFFSCLTGLRWSDIIKLSWDNVQQIGNTVRIVFTQQKTGGIEYLDINPQAAELMGERKAGQLVFPDLLLQARTNITKWVKSAGINKHITFHCARHTFAVMMLDLGVDLYTVSKLLGHKNIKTTQIYAKILDKTKQEAVNRIPDIFGKR